MISSDGAPRRHQQLHRHQHLRPRHPRHGRAGDHRHGAGRATHGGHHHHGCRRADHPPATASGTYQWIDLSGRRCRRSDLAQHRPGRQHRPTRYTLVARRPAHDDQGDRVSFTDRRQQHRDADQRGDGHVSAAPNTPATGAPTITGTAQVGQTLTAVTTAIMDADGLTTSATRTSGSGWTAAPRRTSPRRRRAPTRWWRPTWARRSR